MPKVSVPIRTCIRAASVLLSSGQKIEAEALYRAAYEVAKRTCSSTFDIAFALSALVKFLHSEDRITEATRIELQHLKLGEHRGI